MKARDERPTGMPPAEQGMTRADQRRLAREVQRRAASQRRRQGRLVRWGLFAAVAVAVIAGAYAALSRPGAEPSTLIGRPYVGGDLHALVVDPTNPRRVLVGGHDGGAMSEDGGATWRQLGGLKGADPMGWAIDPRDPLKMYIGGHPGFYRSTDGGANWIKDNGGLPGTDVHGLGIDPRNPDVLYAYVTGQGIYRSADAGRRWELVNAERSIMGPILVDPRDATTLTIAEMAGGFQRSADGGKTWQPVGAIPGGMAMWVAQDQQAPDTFYAANGRVLKSTDGGKSWQPTGDGVVGSASAVAVAPGDSRVVYAGVLEGTAVRLFRSEDGGQTWQARN